MGIGQNCHSSFLPLVQKAPLPVLGMDETKWICFAEVPCGVRATWLHSGKILGQAVEYVSQPRAFFFFLQQAPIVLTQMWQGGHWYFPLPSCVVVRTN